ncbi:Translation initiation factor IF-2 [Salinivirga cyanobacteriivorans]|uniref:Translation initiation factor IF-2 n=1 Tax=Salinivirga cyanobacteriivorans TaxID=1307839 RepID=A0A0S2HZM8_9BACT|nr:translation initiation factor IF-2 [Salinivirga cyanobacteriivorans]ALO15571.1 Translation initiation factor IF-2 [Salinivirga cyanobacteriivorans]
MTQGKKSIRLSKVAKELNVGISTIIDFFDKQGLDIKANPNTKISPEVYDMLVAEYSQDGKMKKESEKLSLGTHRSNPEVVTIDKKEEDNEEDEEEGDEVMIKDLSSGKTASPEAKEEEEKEKKEEVKEEKKEDTSSKKQEKPKEEKPESTKEEKQENQPKVVGKIDLDNVKKARPKKKSEEKTAEKKEKSKAQPEKEKPAQAKPKEAPKPEAKKQKEAPQPKKAKPTPKSAEKEQPKKEPEKKQAPKKEEKDSDFIESKVEKLSGPTVVGKIDLPKEQPKNQDDSRKKKKRRKRIRKDKVDVNKERNDNKQRQKQHTDKKDFPKKKRKKKPTRPEVNEEDVQKQIKETLSRLTSKGKSKGAKYRRDKRDAVQRKQEEEIQQQEQDKNILKVTEFVSVNELANMMDVPATDVIATCMNLGLFVSINQRLDAETMSLVADEFNYKVEFVSAEVLDAIETEEEDDPEELTPRPPIVTVMGHVDHGKTSLLDHIRKENVIAGEAGGITQHIGAYNVKLDDGKRITFLDTPGHEAFTAMRARGAQITDVAIIIIAADDNIMPQTKEAINHAQAAGVPIVFAINKIDKPGASAEKIKEELAQMNLLVEEWGGKYQSQDISAKNGVNIEELLEKVLLEAELLDLKANADKKATGTVIESSLDRGRGYVATVLVEAGTLKIGDIILAGSYYGHVKAMYNERGARIEEAGPAVPVQILGLNGAPQAGDKFNIMESDAEAKDIANKREQLQREQGLRAQKHITLDEIGRRIAIGNFQELNIIVKGDVDGSIEALADSMIKLSTEEIQVNVIHKGVGQISESDILLAAASNAIIVGFQVRPSIAARKLAEKEEIDIRLYSVIYDAINEIRDAMEGMLSPDIKEEVTGTAEVLTVFKITKVGKVAGCIVREGKIYRNSKVRLIREGIVVYTGELGSLKRFKDDVKEVASGYECGLNIENFNDIKVGDMVESFKEVEVKKTL